MAETHKSIAEYVTEIVKPYVEEHGCTLWDVEYVKEGAKQILRITIDKDSGVDINDCEAVHRDIDPVLDEKDPIPVPYYLEVSSPGVERELRTQFHFTYALGQRIDVKLYTAVNGIKQLTGVLNGFDSEKKIIVVGGNELPLDKVSKANIHFDFEN